MTTQSHTELAAQARDYADRIDPFKRVGLDNLTCSSAADALRQCAAALESPTPPGRVQVSQHCQSVGMESCNFTGLCVHCPTPPTAPAQDAQGWTHWEARIKALMEQVGMPNSRSLYQAFAQFAHEMEAATPSPQAATAGAAVALVEAIAKEWDGSEVDVNAVGWVDVGDSIRRNWLPRALRASTPAERVPLCEAQPDWATCKSRGPWARNGLKEWAKELRDKEKRCRNAYTKSFMGEPARYVADACGEAAAVLESKLAGIVTKETSNAS